MENSFEKRGGKNATAEKQETVSKLLKVGHFILRLIGGYRDSASDHRHGDTHDNGDCYVLLEMGLMPHESKSFANSES